MFKPVWTDRSALPLTMLFCIYRSRHFSRDSWTGCLFEILPRGPQLRSCSSIPSWVKQALPLALFPSWDKTAWDEKRNQGGICQALYWAQSKDPDAHFKHLKWLYRSRILGEKAIDAMNLERGLFETNIFTTVFYYTNRIHHIWWHEIEMIRSFTVFCSKRFSSLANSETPEHVFSVVLCLTSKTAFVWTELLRFRHYENEPLGDSNLPSM